MEASDPFPEALVFVVLLFDGRVQVLLLEQQLRQLTLQILDGRILLNEFLVHREQLVVLGVQIFIHFMLLFLQEFTHRVVQISRVDVLKQQCVLKLYPLILSISKSLIPDRLQV